MRDYFLDGKSELLVEGEELTVDTAFRDMLKRNKLQTLAEFMSVSRENAFRDVRERLTVGLDLPVNDDGKTLRVYLKRHWKEKAVKSKGPRKEALIEYNNIKALEAQNVRVPQTVACGSGYINGRPVGFMMVVEVPGIPSDDYIKDQFPKQGINESSLQSKRKFVRQLAENSSRFHGLGYNHRDFYLCHTFVIKQNENYIFHLIDLQRVQNRRLLRRRWLVKDLAQMNYSVPEGMTNTDRLRFYLRYQDIKSLDKKHKSLIKAILRKTHSIAKREKQGKVR